MLDIKNLFKKLKDHNTKGLEDKEWEVEVEAEEEEEEDFLEVEEDQEKWEEVEDMMTLIDICQGKI